MAINGSIGLMCHGSRKKNKHTFKSNFEFQSMETINDPDVLTKYIYHDEFQNDDNEKHINVENLDITKFYKLEKPLCYHLNSMKQVKSFQHGLCIFYAIYNISAMKMHQLH